MKVNKNINDVKPFGIKRNIDYIKVNIFLMWKNLIEYKTNFIFLLLNHILFIFLNLFFYKILINNFSDQITWDFSDFFLFFVFCEIIWIITGMFAWKSWLETYIINGDFNKYLLRPQKTFFAYFFSEINQYALFYLIIDLVIYSIIIYLYIEILFSFRSIFILLMIIILMIYQLEFFRSFDFYYLGLSKSLFSPVWEISKLTRNYPFQFFSKINLKFILLFIPFIFISSLLIPTLKNYEIWEKELQLGILLSLSIIFYIGTWINWHYGLKKYEAFG